MTDYMPDGWKLIHPIDLSEERDEDGSWLVSNSWPWLSTYGQGNTLDEARRDFYQSLTELYELCERDSLRDGATWDKSAIAFLSQYIRRMQTCEEVSRGNP